DPRRGKNRGAEEIGPMGPSDHCDSASSDKSLRCIRRTIKCTVTVILSLQRSRSPPASHLEKTVMHALFVLAALLWSAAIAFAADPVGTYSVEGPVRKVVGIRSGIISDKLLYHIMRRDQIADRWVL